MQFTYFHRRRYLSEITYVEFHDLVKPPDSILLIYHSVQCTKYKVR